jgi:hypothetical protein
MPAFVPAGGSSIARLANVNGQLVLTSDGNGSHMWLAPAG